MTMMIFAEASLLTTVTIVMWMCVFLMWQNIFAYVSRKRIEEKLDRLLDEQKNKNQ